jgi:hypothetical protein
MRSIVLCSLVYYFALSREFSFQEVVGFESSDGVFTVRAKEVVAASSIIGTNKIQYICSSYIPRASRKT